MKKLPLLIVAFSVVAMLLMQMSGMHLHAGTHGETAGVHGAHMHGVTADGHDHSNAVDVNLIDFGLVWSNLLPVLLTTFPALLAIVWILHALWAPAVVLMPPSRRSRWRPPLRAPPLSF